MNDELAERAWKRIEELGGHGVWEREMMVVSLAKTRIADENLARFGDFPYVNILDLSTTTVTDNCFRHLQELPSLRTLILIDTAITSPAIAKFKSSHPGVEVKTEPTPKKTINPFTRKTFDA